jgi:putative ATP-dependent endonuclease of OLD family
MVIVKYMTENQVIEKKEFKLEVVMYLKEVQIRNYKNFLKARFLFQKGVNVVIGENDSGKTNLMQAIRLVLDKRMDWRDKEISEKMFPDMLDDWRGHIIIISLRFAELDENKEEEAILKYLSGNQNKEGALTWFCLPDSLIVKVVVSKNLYSCFDRLSDIVLYLT